ncbi:MAG: heme-degrading domain-containing protein [Rhodoglobus sp.]
MNPSDPTLDALIAEVIEQEKRLVLTSFTNDDAWELGGALRAMAIERGHAVEIDVSRGEHRLFHCALPGTKPHNGVWIERKKRTVREFEASSYRVGLQFPILDAHTLESAPWMNPHEFAGFGGGFPVTIAGVGVVGTIAVSGLPHQEDHALIVEALERHLAR